MPELARLRAAGASSPLLRLVEGWLREVGDLRVRSRPTPKSLPVRWVLVMAKLVLGGWWKSLV